MSRIDFDMSFLEHLEELRWRIIKSMVIILFGAFIAYFISDEIIRLLLLPTHSLDINMNLQVLKITSMFSIKLSVSLFCVIIIGLSLLLYQFWKFFCAAFERQYGYSIFFIILFFKLDKMVQIV